VPSPEGPQLRAGGVLARAGRASAQPRPRAAPAASDRSLRRARLPRDYCGRATLRRFAAGLGAAVVHRHARARATPALDVAEIPPAVEWRASGRARSGWPGAKTSSRDTLRPQGITPRGRLPGPAICISQTRLSGAEPTAWGRKDDRSELNQNVCPIVSYHLMVQWI
jgi:hypothetical protein